MYKMILLHQSIVFVFFYFSLILQNVKIIGRVSQFLNRFGNNVNGYNEGSKRPFPSQVQGTGGGVAFHSVKASPPAPSGDLVGGSQHTAHRIRCRERKTVLQLNRTFAGQSTPRRCERNYRHSLCMCVRIRFLFQCCV